MAKTESKRGSTNGTRKEPAGGQTLQIMTPSGVGVTGILMMPDSAFAMYVLAHGAGAGMRHPFMEGVADRLAERGVATLRYQFPYTEAGRQAPDKPPVLIGTVRAAVARAREVADGLPLFAGGKSMGGRMTSTAAAEAGWLTEEGESPDNEAELVHGIAFLGFPLHPPGKPSSERADHLARVKQPMLFLQGTRDTFAAMDKLEPVLQSLGKRARLHLFEGADHGFHVPKSTGRNDEQVLDEVADEMVKWMREILGVRT